eukprot:scaffold952_cov409-Prasinococcus_capsulatus_cf.AAC.7
MTGSGPHRDGVAELCRWFDQHLCRRGRCALACGSRDGTRPEIEPTLGFHFALKYRHFITGSRAQLPGAAAGVRRRRGQRRAPSHGPTITGQPVTRAAVERLPRRAGGRAVRAPPPAARASA